VAGDTLVPRNIVEELKGVSFFQDLSQEALELVLKRMVRRRISSGTTLFRKGEQARGVYLLSKGQVEIYRSTPDGREQVIHVENPVESIAELPVFDGGPYPASCRTSQESEVLFLSLDDFKRLYREHPEISDAVIRHLGKRLRDLVRVVERSSLRSVPERVAKTLLEEAERVGVAKDGGTFTLHGTQSDLAHLLATSRESVARALGELRREGVIATDGRKVTIISLSQLVDLAQGESGAKPLQRRRD
jgi:CRP/FNR family transcriptional regulator